ncbi:uncharacterized protein LOC135392581 [Ornithodoros turicata]|uniref:uncharacterized protein LOC135392581 n=1 Tax=Ornithodoros turicata TaxID=34597 RepID=UPI003138C379
MATQQAPADISAIQIKLPEFWPNDPQVWFTQVEAQFALRNISSQTTRFNYVVAALTPSVATEVRDVLLSPPDEKPYDTLKEQLISRTSASEQRRIQQLLTSEELGDRRPTQLLRRLQQLLGEKASTIDETLLRELFLQRLPASVRMILASAKSTTLSDIANMADNIMDVGSPVIAAVGSQYEPPAITELRRDIIDLKDTLAARDSHAIDDLRAEMNKLVKMVQSLGPTQRGRSRSASRRPAPARRRSPAPSNNGNALCWYHQTFGDNARQCQPPCSRAGNGTASS